LDRGWLLGPFDGTTFFRPDAIGLLGDADWGAVAGQWGALATVVVLAAISVMIHVHALEEVSGRDFDVDHELRVAGIGAAGAGLVGSMPGSMYLADTVLLERVGGPNRGAALLSALTGGVVLLAGASVLSIIPTAVIGGVLLSLGLAFVVEWLWDRRRRLERSDRILILVIGTTVVVFGFLEAIALGTAIAIVLFVIRYSRVEAIRHAYSLDSFRSAVDRPALQTAALDDLGDRAVVLEVHGYLFFGSAHRVFGDPRLDTPDLRYAVFDLARVSGIDSSATTAFLKLARRAGSRDFEIVLAGMPEAVDRLLGPLADDSGGVHRFADLDAAIEWCEDGILERSHHGSTAPPRLDDLLGAGTGGEIVAGRFDRLELGASDVLVRRGEQAPGLFFLESGSVTAWLPTAAGEPVRLRTMQPGTVIGEISLYLGGEATADVIADEPSVVLHVSPEDLVDLERRDPAAAAAIHRFAARTLANRVLHAERAVRTLTDGSGPATASGSPGAR
jgi:SulP family sulfate permease